MVSFGLVLVLGCYNHTSHHLQKEMRAVIERELAGAPTSWPSSQHWRAIPVAAAPVGGAAPPARQEGWRGVIDGWREKMQRLMGGGSDGLAPAEEESLSEMRDRFLSCMHPPSGELPMFNMKNLAWERGTRRQDAVRGGV